MTMLSANERSFVTYLQRSPEHLRKGIALLLERDNYVRFFDALAEAQLFNPENNPAPVLVDDGKYYRVPYWPVLDYLVACAKLADRTSDADLAGKVMGVVRNVSRHETSADNHHTYRVFADIVGFLPPGYLTLEDVDLVASWLTGRFDRGGVCHSLDNGAMKRFLASADPSDWRKALRLLRHCSAVTWIEEDRGAGGAVVRRPRSVADEYWLGKFLEHHAATLASKLGREAVDTLTERVRELFGDPSVKVPSYLLRPAIEAHKQNVRRGTIEGAFVDAIRDAITAWLDANPADAKAFVASLLTDNLDILRRIGLFAVNARWALLSDLYFTVLNPALFDLRHVHELYDLLVARFATFTEDQKTATLDAISNITIDNGKTGEDRLRSTKARWLSAIAGKGLNAADQLFHDLGGTAVVGEHANFLTYMESWSGPGPSAYSPTELLVALKDGSLVDLLNGFVPTSSWRGPSVAALVDALESAIGSAPSDFLVEIGAFDNAKRSYQYGFVNGFKMLWDKTSEEDSASPLWTAAWPALLEFFERLITADSFWAEKILEHEDLAPTRDWIPGLIADFIDAGTNSDKKCFAPSLLAKALHIIDILLAKSERVSEPSDDDPMTQSINSPKGKAIEALYSHSLRVSRIADKATGGHDVAWTNVVALFDRELNLCRSDNFEFSTLAGTYLPNLQYLNAEWVVKRIADIFPKEYESNYLCAVAGLAYAAATSDVFKLLREHDVINRALSSALPGRHSREKLLQRLALAYVWGDEPIDSPRFTYLFESKRTDDLREIASFFWSVSNQELSKEQVERVLEYWRRCVTWSHDQQPAPTELLATLSQLLCYFEVLHPDDVPLVSETVRHVSDENSWDLSEELGRLATVSPAEVSAVAGVLFEQYSPVTDYDDRWKTLVRTLAAHGQRPMALNIAERLNSLPGMDGIFKDLKATTTL